MDKLKRKIIKYFILCAFGISVAESMWDSTFDEVLFPFCKDNVTAGSMLMVLYFVLTAAIFAAFAFLFYRLINKAVEAESERQVKERNLVYSGITHDLKTPMTSVQGFAAALLEDRIKPEEQKEILDIIYKKSCYMNELVESMFTYSKMNADDYHLSCKKMDLGALVREAVALNYDEFEKRGMDLQVEIPEEPLFCLLDGKEMKRAIHNLLVNAYKHNGAGGKIMVRVSKQGKEVFVTVADNGKEITKEQGEKLFEPFVCGNDARSGGQGNGLGLTIARLIAEKHGGKLYVRNNMNEYTKGFVIQLHLS